MGGPLDPSSSATSNVSDAREDRSFVNFFNLKLKPKLLIISAIAILNTQVTNGGFVNFTLIHSAVSKGAVCLDGSPPGYAIDKGSGYGSNNWVVYIEGGGWCSSTSDCVGSSKGMHGSSSGRNRIYLSGILDQNQKFNPDFYNWNKVHVIYCDGASFMSDIKKVDPKNNLTFRGARIFEAIMAELLAKGMMNATNAILCGGSAGGLATILHCDKFRALISDAARVKCISDSGFFIHAKHLPGAKTIRERRFAHVTKVHRLSKRLPISCTSKVNSKLCLFPENLVEDVQTPLFLLESAFDKFQIEENYIRSVGGTLKWRNCTNNVTHCTSDEIKLMQDFRSAFIETLQKLDNCPSRGMFVHSCYRHGHITTRDGWRCSSVVGNNVLANKTIGEAIGDWYFDRSSFQVIDTHNDVPRDCNNTLSFDEFNSKCLNKHMLY